MTQSDQKPIRGIAAKGMDVHFVSATSLDDAYWSRLLEKQEALRSVVPLMDHAGVSPLLDVDTNFVRPSREEEHADILRIVERHIPAPADSDEAGW